MPTQGKIYILRNPYLQDSLVKIGKTSRISETRAKELSAATGVPGAFEVLYEEDVFDVDLAETLAHHALDGFRANPRREFFRLPLKIAVREVATICRDLERMQKGYADPRVVIFMGDADARKLKQLVEPYRGGNTKITIVYSNKNAVAEFDMGDDWRLHLSTALIRDLQKWLGCPGIMWIWDDKDKTRREPQEVDLEDEIPF
jgi:T5orf172 domain